MERKPAEVGTGWCCCKTCKALVSCPSLHPQISQRGRVSFVPLTGDGFVYFSVLCTCTCRVCVMVSFSWHNGLPVVFLTGNRSECSFPWCCCTHELCPCHVLHSLRRFLLCEIPGDEDGGSSRSQRLLPLSRDFESTSPGREEPAQHTVVSGVVGWEEEEEAGFPRKRAKVEHRRA